MSFQNLGVRVGRIILLFTLYCLVAASVVIIGFTIWARIVPSSTLDESLFLTATADRTTRLYCYGENGEIKELLNDRISGYQNALYASFAEIPDHLKNAFIAIEDKRFYDHGGIDWIRTLSAFGGYLKGEMSFGGSTITQQLIKNLTEDNERSARRKVGELMRAAALERRYNKQEILEQYLNVVNLAQNCYGVKTASNAYFSKEPNALTLAECATIAAITNNPAKYDPIRHPAANHERRNIILSEMRRQNMISEEEYFDALSSATSLAVNEKVLSGRINSYYADMVVADVIAALVKERGMSTAAASKMIYCGGLKIYTAMDEALQEIVTAYYEDTTNFPTHGTGEKAESAMMIVDPATGDILAVAGAIGAKRANRIQNFAVDARRPSGSVIKPLSVYGPALELGVVNYATVFDDIPLTFRNNGAPWPRNSPNIYRGLTTVSRALTDSVNTVSVSIFQRLGAGNSYDFLTKHLGFTSLNRKNDIGAAALALGQQHEGVTLREIIGGYTAVSNKGMYTGTKSYYKVEDHAGRVLLECENKEKRVLSEENAAILTMMLRKAVREGTGKALSLKNTVDVAGKTGTSSNNCDKWFVGYTPELLAGVWYGHEYPKSLSDIKGNPALAIFDDVMRAACEIYGEKGKSFENPDNLIAVRYCKDSGLLPCEACLHDPRGDRLEIGYFKRGTEPTRSCDRHVLIDYCAHGGIATDHCAPEMCYQTALLRITRRFPRSITVLDAPFTFEGIWEEGRKLTKNEPYYAAKYDSEIHVGIGYDVIPYNRICQGHEEEDLFWKRRGA